MSVYIVHVVGSPVAEKGGALKPQAATKKMPRLKVEATLSNIRVAIVEDMEDPQALTLRVSSPPPPSPAFPRYCILYLHTHVVWIYETYHASLPLF